MAKPSHTNPPSRAYPHTRLNERTIGNLPEPKLFFDGTAVFLMPCISSLYGQTVAYQSSVAGVSAHPPQRKDDRQSARAKTFFRWESCVPNALYIKPLWPNRRIPILRRGRIRTPASTKGR